ncbi:MAG: PAS domain-containing sensor histidine kinase [Campylobacteraceae bacterium]|jgi:PAS domain S-box-containing protein|nr:PAS domain-containing sensor histidine kinase [Campylobacteraceae bacterium]
MGELRQYKIAIEQSNIVSKTDINGIITFVNEEFCKISGYNKNELIGKNHNIVRHPDVPKSNFELLWNTILKKETFKATAKNRAKDGSTFYVNTTISPILDKNGNILEFIAIRYDVTENILLTEELKRKEEELKHLNATLENRVEKQTKQLLDLNRNLEKKVKEEVEKNREKDKVVFQQARLAAMGEMIGNIAHQWRQPLSELGIILFSMKKFLVQKDLGKLEEQYEQGKKVIDRMSQTIEDFRNFFSLEKHKNIFFIKDTINEVVSILAGSLARAKIHVRIRARKTIKVFGHKNELSQAILNIINNAKEAFKDKNIKKRTIVISAKKGEGFVYICIQDNAGGIDETIIDKVFEPYFTTKHASSGTGLGLYIVKTIIENSMQGEITVDNRDGGAFFMIKIPIK